nr:immunoglobulin heavy chain junction region [Mus musculus]
CARSDYYGSSYDFDDW